MLLGTLLLSGSSLSHAQSLLDPEAFEFKTRIEKLIKERLESEIATTLESHAFTVNASVNVVLAKDPVKTEKDLEKENLAGEKAAQDKANKEKLAREKAEAKDTTKLPEKAISRQDFTMPADLTMGLINAADIIAKYEEENQKLRAQAAGQTMAVDLTKIPELTQAIGQAKTAAREATLASEALNNATQAAANGAVKAKRYVVTSVFVSVGLDEDLGQDYVSSFNDWLRKRVKTSFGANAKTEATLIKKKPVVKEPVKEKTLLERVGELQNLIGYIVIAMTVVIALILFKSLISKEAGEQRKLAIQLQNIQETKAAPETIEKSDLPTEVLLDPETELRSIKELVVKICSLAIELNENVNVIFSQWLQNGERGQLKMACMCDALMNVNQVRARTVAVPAKDFQLNIEVPSEYKEDMLEVFTKMSAMSIKEKHSLFEEVYWDLITLKSLGRRSVEKPFSYIGSLPATQMQQVLGAQNPTVKSLAVLHLPQDIQRKYLSGLRSDERFEILTQSITLEKIPETDLETTNESLKYVVQNSAVSAAGEVVLSGLLPKLLGAYTADDELLMLRDVVRRLPDRGLKLKLTWPTLAFIDEWPKDRLEQILSSSTSEEIYALLRTVPDMKTIILAACPQKLAMIVESDLNIPDRMKPEDKLKNLETLRLKLIRAANRGEISLAQIFERISGDSMARAA